MLRKVLALAAVLGAFAAPAFAATTSLDPVTQAWSFNGPFGMYDQEQLQRGFKVYEQVCSACHSINYIAFHNLGDPGGPFWNPRYPSTSDNPWVKAIAAGWPRQVADINTDTGDPTHRPATPADILPPPFPNDSAARASNGGAAPPDMSLLVNARDGGPNYVFSVASGFPANAPAGLDVPPGKYYNPYFPGDVSANWHGDPAKVPPGGFISMPPPLTDCKVTFDDGKPCDVRSEARDVAAFLQWASDPKMDERKQIGIAVVIYLSLFSIILYFSYRRIWRNVAH